MNGPEPIDNLIPMPTAREVFDSLVPEPETAFQRICRENDITQESYNKQPRVTSFLRQLPGGFEVVMEYLRGNDDPDAVKFLDVYDRLGDDASVIGFEGICAAAGVQGRKLYHYLVGEATIEGENQMALLTAIKAPGVINATLDMALQPQGHRERNLVAKASGWLPRPKGSQTNININNGRINQGNTTNVALPAFDLDIRELGERMQAMGGEPPKLLEGDK